MFIQVYESSFHDYFIGSQYENNFSYAGRSMLFEYLEQYEDDTGEKIELDIVALCCDYSEDNFEYIINNYNIDVSECVDEDEKIAAVEDYLNDNTMLIGKPFSDVFLYQVF